MVQFKIKDNSKIKKEELLEIETLTKKVSDKTLEQLEKEGVFLLPNSFKEADDISPKQMILQSDNDCFLSGNIMGFLGYGNMSLEIESRFSTGKTDYFFQYLLWRVLGIPNVINHETEANSDDRLYNLMVFIFPHYLKAATRKGLYKTYIRKEYNDENVKGTIDIAKHIKQNNLFVGKVAYTQREYSKDNYLLELIRHTIEFIKKKPYGNRLLGKVKHEVEMIVEATTDYEQSTKRKIIDLNKKNIVRHAFFCEYRALQKLCIFILQDRKQQFGTGTQRVHGILFDGAWLWEEYINTLIGDDFYHPMNKKGKGGQRLFAGNTGLIFPDFISRDGTNCIIADAKYKPSNNIENKDYLQILAYMFRFDSKMGYFLYPESKAEGDIWLSLNKGNSYDKNVGARGDVYVIKHGLHVPNDAVDYKNFVSQIQSNEKKFIDEIKCI